MQKRLFQVKSNRIGIVAVGAALAVFTMLTLVGCAQRVSIPDVTGMSPYEAKQLLEQDISDAQVNFVTVKGTEVTVENSEHYSGWKVIATEENDNSSKELLATIQMTDLEVEKRNASISDHIQSEAVSGWSEGSITYYDSEELLTFRYQSEGDTSPNRKLDNLAENLNGTILAAYYTDDNYLKAIQCYSQKNAPSDQLSRAEEETARMVEEADLYAAQHLDGYMSNYISETFPPDFGDPPMWSSASYVLTDTGVVITVVFASGYSFMPTNVSAAYTMDELADSWQRAATAISFYTQTGVRFEFHSSSRELELGVASEGIKGYDVWNQAESEPLLPK